MGTTNESPLSFIHKFSYLISGQKHRYGRGVWLLLRREKGGRETSQSNSFISGQWLVSSPIHGQQLTWVTSAAWGVQGRWGLVETIPVISLIACRGWPENDLSWLVTFRGQFTMIVLTLISTHNIQYWDVVVKMTHSAYIICILCIGRKQTYVWVENDPGHTQCIVNIKGEG